MNDSWSSFVPIRSIKKDIEFKGLYNKRHTGKVQISSVSGIFGFNLHCDVYFFLSVSKKNDDDIIMNQNIISFKM